MPDVAGRVVFVFDFSYPRPILEDMAAQAQSLYLLDHHASAMAQLSDLPYCHFDTSQSGAALAWQLYHGKSLPWLIAYIQDRDLWHNALPNTEEVAAYIHALPQSFELWQQVLETGVEEAVIRGRGCLMVRESYVTQMMRQARTLVAIDVPVPVVNACFMHGSDLLHVLAAPEGVPYAMSWWQRGDGRFQYSLRSAHGFDVAALAQTMGGGGHPAAAGFVTDQLLPTVRG